MAVIFIPNFKEDGMAKAKYKPWPDGKFRTRVWDGTFNDDGSKHRKYLVSEKSSRDLERMVNEHNYKLSNGEYAPPANITLGDYAVTWLNTFKSVKERSTKASYSIYVNAYFKPCTICISGITRHWIQNLINEKIAYPRACEMLRLVWKQIISSAVDDQLLPAAAERRLCSKISVPKRPKTKRRPLTADEKRYIQIADFSPSEKLFVFVLYGTGIRKSEALALTVRDVDLVNRTLRIEHSVGYEGNVPYLKSPKSENGYRTIPLPDYLIPLFQAAPVNAQGRYFYGCRAKDSLMTLSSYTKFWARIAKKIEAVADDSYECDLTAHYFRHNYCTSLCYQIPLISIKKIAQLMGDREDMVIDVYSHIMDSQEKVSEALAAAVGF